MWRALWLGARPEVSDCGDGGVQMAVLPEEDEEEESERFAGLFLRYQWGAPPLPPSSSFGFAGGGLAALGRKASSKRWRCPGGGDAARGGGSEMPSFCHEFLPGRGSGSHSVLMPASLFHCSVLNVAGAVRQCCCSAGALSGASSCCCRIPA